jgi:hypothetical protein
MEKSRYNVYLRFYLDSNKNPNAFPIGERQYDKELSLHQTLYLPHQKDPFFSDMPPATVEAITPNIVIGEPPLLYASISLPKGREDLRLIVGRLFRWYAHEEQNLSQINFPFPDHSYAKIFLPAKNYHETVRNGVEKMKLHHRREQNLLNSSSPMINQQRVQ